ncbi:MAG: AbrB/MazE/SpoVT family DNA-binding domain-containing protein [Firmicutes bacterium]|nr:AbrB/MazE/SpoVT family DNA-binding domain-containing protein [Bacillota bacterium]
MDTSPCIPGEQEEESAGRDVSRERIKMFTDGSIEIPLHMREKLGIQAWDDILFAIEGEAIVITKATAPQVRAAEPHSFYLADNTRGSTCCVDTIDEKSH